MRVAGPITLSGVADARTRRTRLSQRSVGVPLQS